MRDLAFLAAFTVSGVGIYRWHRWFWPVLILAAVSVFERNEPEPEPQSRLLVRDLTVADVRWGRADFPATHPIYEWVVPT